MKHFTRKNRQTLTKKNKQKEEFYSAVLLNKKPRKKYTKKTSRQKILERPAPSHIHFVNIF